jgi:hypothetical protein
MRIFSRFVFLCNVCFLISLVFRLVEIGMKKGGNNNAAIPLPFLEGSIVILGFVVAVIFNAAFVFIMLYRKSIRRPLTVGGFLLWFNLILFPIEIWYLFFRPY